MEEKYKQAHACYERMRSSYFEFMHNDKIDSCIDEFAEAAFMLMSLDLENPFPDETDMNAAKTPDQGNVITAVKEDEQ